MILGNEIKNTNSVKKKFKLIKVVNYVTERMIQLIEDFNDKLDKLSTKAICIIGITQY